MTRAAQISPVYLLRASKIDQKRFYSTGCFTSA
jgi:hypothetical protein